MWGRTGRRTSRPSRAAVGRAGEVADEGAADDAAHAPAEHAEAPAVGVGGSADGFGQARRLPLDHGAGALGGEVARPEPGTAGREHHPGEAGGELAERARDRSTPSRRDLDGRRPRSRPRERGGQRRTRAVLARPVDHAVGHREHLGPQHRQPVTAPRRRGSRGRPRRDRRRGRSRCRPRGCRHRPRRRGARSPR